jgi:acetolactate synthase-1/2/3 large subunit
MNGAEGMMRTLAGAGVKNCFMNPGTSEIHFVDALDRVTEIRAIPCLFEGVAAGAADGFARMAGRPASTLFHLGPGLSNALANLHNAFRARVPLVNIVGDHATWHLAHDAPLTSDIAAIARPTSGFLRASRSAADLGQDCADAISASQKWPGQISTLIVPADASWDEGATVAKPTLVAGPAAPSARTVERAATMLRNGARTAIILGQGLIEGDALTTAGRIAAATGATLVAQFSFRRISRGEGLPPVARIPYVSEDARAFLRGFDQLILVGAPAPVSFFAQQGQPSVLTEERIVIHLLSEADEDGPGALAELAGVLNAGGTAPIVQKGERPSLPGGPITIAGLAEAVGAVIPAGVIVVDESITSGRGMMAATKGAPPHDWLVNTGGSIGIGMPLALGAAIACPDRPVLCLEADGSGLYTPQTLWTVARERLRVTTVVFSNRSYAILKGELGRLGRNPGPRALDTLDIGRPDVDWVSLAKALGVAATRVDSLESFATALKRGLSGDEPNLIEVPL